ncbi:MAG TPA: hypothetical protein DCP28_31370, partial [Cytophagales bacterium]|nr:hypothetical protein [Cytophagales bacterium]
EKRMSITAVLFFDGSESRDENDLVAAYIDGEVRGVGAPTTYYAEDDRFLVLFQVGDNDVSGSTITFRLYDASTDTEYPVEETLTFVAESSEGVVSEPYVITNNYLPTDIDLSDATIEENLVVNTAIGTFSSTDQDSIDTFTYSFVTDELLGPDNGSFTIDDNILRTAEIYNHEVKESYTIYVRTTDNKNGNYDESFTITIDDANDPPTAATLTNQQVSELEAVGTYVGLLKSVDEDSIDTYTYQITGNGTDNHAFTLNGDSLVTTEIFDFEAQSSYGITVTTTDATGESFAQGFTISIVDANDDPTDLDLNNLLITENQAVFTTIGQFSTTDQDAGDTFTYTLQPGTEETADEASFLIAEEELRSNAVFNFEEQNQFVLTVRTTDEAGAQYEEDFTITVVDDNDAPTDIDITNLVVGENLDAATAIGILSTTDEDVQDLFTYSLVTDETLGPDSELFLMDGNTLRTDTVFDFEVDHSFLIRIQTTDSAGASYEESYTVTITDENDAPTALDLNENRIEELRAPGTLIGTFATTDEDAVDNFTYTLTGNLVDNAAFTIVDNELRTAIELDRESQSAYRIEVTSTDKGGETFVETFVIEVIDQNEAPELGDALFTMVENREAGYLLGTLEATDIDSNQSQYYKILLEDPLYFIEEFPFALDSVTGDLTVNIKDSLDYEKQDLYVFDVMVVDNGPFALTDTAEIIVRITDEPEGLLPVNDLVSPNQDGFNDFFEITNPEVYADYRLTIFSSEGTVLYTAQPYNNEWDGTYQGRTLPSGIYYYLFENTEGFIYRGMINLKTQ